MDETRRIFEHKALRNVRALFERLERDDLRHRRRQWYLALFAVLPIALFLGMVLTHPPSSALRPLEVRSCELESVSARSEEFRRTLERSNPEMTPSEIQKQLEHEQPYLMAAARVHCDRRAR